MVPVQNIYNIFEGHSEEWDNNGVLIGDEKKEIDNIVTAMDVTKEVLNQCNSGDLLITHHPLIFDPIKSIKSNDLAYKIIKRDISYIALHTVLDYSYAVHEHLINTLRSSKYGNLCSRGFLNDGECKLGIKYSAPSNIEDIVNFYKYLNKTNNPFLFYDSFNPEMLNHAYLTVAFIQGSGNAFINQILDDNLDLFVTGELNYHNIQKLRENTTSVLLLGHKTSENFLLDIIEREIKKIYPELHIFTIKDSFEAEIL